MIKDKDIRFKFILENKKMFNSGIFINEYGINHKNVIDFALLKDGYLYGYEIKSEADNLKRLPNQLKAYLKIFDYIYIIVQDKHKSETYELLNKYNLLRVGVYSVDYNSEIKKEREALLTSPSLRTRGILNNLKKEDLLELNRSLRLSTLNKCVDELKNSICGKVPLKTLTDKLEKSLLNNYSKSCSKCNSNLIYNTSGIVDKITKEYKIDKVHKLSKTLSYKQKIRNHFCRCIECNHIFDEKICETLEKKLIKVDSKKL